MAGENPYVAALKQSEIPPQICRRAVWYLNGLGRDLRTDAAHEKFSTTWDAFLKLNIPVTCKGTRKRGVKSASCYCYPPLSGLGRKRKPRGGNRI